MDNPIAAMLLAKWLIIIAACTSTVYVSCGMAETQRDDVLSEYARGLLVSNRRRYLEKIAGRRSLLDTE